MARTVRGQISEMIRDVEKAARQIRSEVRKKYNVTPKVLDQAASQLRRGAAEAAYQVERYIREVRMELQENGGGKTGRKKTARKATRKTAKKTARKTAKRTAKKAAPKTARATAKKTAKKTTRKGAKKATRKTAKKATRRRSAR